MQNTAEYQLFAPHVVENDMLVERTKHQKKPQRKSSFCGHSSPGALAGSVEDTAEIGRGERGGGAVSGLQ